MKFKRYDKRFNKMLWIGLGIWVVSILLSLILDWCGVKVDSQDTLIGIAKQLFHSSPILCLLLLCVFGPLLEECSFRLWGRGKTWCVIVCMLLMMAFTCAEMHSWWPILLIAALTTVCFVVKDRFRRNWIVAVGSSFLFAICHISGYGSFSMGMVVGLVDIFGFALVLSYLTINLSFWFSVLLHVLNNSCVILIPMLFVGEPIHVETAQYTIDATPFKAFADNSRCWDSVNYEDVHQVSWNGELPEIVCFLYSFGTAVINDTIIYDWRGGESLESRYFMKAQCKDSVVAIGSVKVYRDIARLLMQEAKVVADTDVVVASSIWVVDADGTETRLDDREDALQISVKCQGLYDEESIYWSRANEDGTESYWAYYAPNEISKQSEEIYNAARGYKFVYKPDHKVTRVVFRMSDN